MDTQKTVETARNIAARTAGWGKRTFTARRLKKGAGCLAVLAVLGGAGKFAAHQAKAAAKLQEAEAKTTLLQNLAAQKNITLVSTDQVKESIASTLGVDASEINFRSVRLEDQKPGEKKAGNEKKEKDKKEKRDKKGDKGQKERKENKENKNNKKQNADLKQENKRQPMPPQGNGQNGPKPGEMPAQGQPGMGQQPQDGSFRNMPPQDGMKPEGQPPMQNGGTERPFAAPAPQQMKKANKFPGFYLAECEKDGMRYHFIVDAQNGQVLRAQVHKLNPIAQLLS